MSVRTFAWNLSQERVDMLADALRKLEAVLDTAAPGMLGAENAAKLLTDLREQTTAQGADDPFPYREMYPNFADDEIPERATPRCRTSMPR